MNEVRVGIPAKTITGYRHTVNQRQFYQNKVASRSKKPPTIKHTINIRYQSIRTNFTAKATIKPKI